MFSNDNELKKYLYLISYAGIILAIILNLSSVFSFIQYLWQLIIPFIEIRTLLTILKTTACKNPASF